MPLGRNYRWQVYNGTGVSVTCTVKTRDWKFDSSGALAPRSTEVTHINAVSVGAGAYSNPNNVDNSTDLMIGADVTFTFAPSASATGIVALFLQKSTDGGTTWPDNGKGFQVAAEQFSASSSTAVRNGQFS